MATAWFGMTGGGSSGDWKADFYRLVAPDLITQAVCLYGYMALQFTLIQRFGWTTQNHATTIQYGDRLRKGAGKLEILLDEEDGHVASSA